GVGSRAVRLRRAGPPHCARRPQALLREGGQQVHSFEKVGNKWVAKKQKGPSDERAKRGQRPGGESAGGVDVEGHTKEELYERAKKLGVEGRSKMNKLELAQAIARKQD